MTQKILMKSEDFAARILLNVIIPRFAQCEVDGLLCKVVAPFRALLAEFAEATRWTIPFAHWCNVYSEQATWPVTIAPREPCGLSVVRARFKVT